MYTNVVNADRLHMLHLHDLWTHEQALHPERDGTKGFGSVVLLLSINYSNSIL